MLTLEKNYIGFHAELAGVQFSCESGFIDDGWLFIKKSYKWDGCTYAINTEKTYIASLIHDFFYEYGPISRELADKLFYKQLKKDNFQLSLIYYISVRLFGYTRYNVMIKLNSDYERFLTDLMNIEFKCSYGYIDDGLLKINTGYSYKTNIWKFNDKKFCNVFLIYKFLKEFSILSIKNRYKLLYYLLELDGLKFKHFYYIYVILLN
jgi:hypothetical protein